LEKRFQGSFITVEKLKETKGRILEAGKAVPVRSAQLHTLKLFFSPLIWSFSSNRAQRRWRAVVTGDPNKRIRDHMKETPQVKMMDKASWKFDRFFCDYLYDNYKINLAIN